MYQIQLLGEPFIYNDGVPETYVSESEALLALYDSIQDEIEAVADGFMESVTESSDYRIIDLGANHE
jgi:hypothetical protein